MVCWAIAEKLRWTPVYAPLACDTPVPSGLSIASPLAAASALQPSPSSPPYGLHVNMTVTTACTNPSQSEITILAEGYSAVALAPNATDLANGGVGVPYTEKEKVHLAADVMYPVGGKVELVNLVETAMAMDNALAGVTPEATMRGYWTAYARTAHTVRTCSTVLGLASCVDTPMTQFCGYYEGSRGPDPPPAKLCNALCYSSKSRSPAQATAWCQCSTSLGLLWSRSSWSQPSAPTQGAPKACLRKVENSTKLPTRVGILKCPEEALRRRGGGPCAAFPCKHGDPGRAWSSRISRLRLSSETD